MVWYLHCSFWFSVCIRLFFSCLGDERLFPRNGIPYILHTKGAFTLHCNLTNVLKISNVCKYSEADLTANIRRPLGSQFVLISFFWYCFVLCGLKISFGQRSLRRSKIEEVGTWDLAVWWPFADHSYFSWQIIFARRERLLSWVWSQVGRRLSCRKREAATWES